MTESIPKKRSLPLNIALISLALIATFAYLEIGVRVLAPAAFPLLRTDPDVGTIHVTNYDGMAWSARSQKYVHIVTNSLGYIGDEITSEKPNGVIRIAVLGDSVVEGLEVNTSDTFPVLLQRTLNALNMCHGIRFEVMNFGVSGTGTFMQYQTFKKKIAQLKPNYTLLVFHDDYEDNIAKSNFDLENFANERRSVGLKSLLLRSELLKFVFSKVQTNHLVLKVLRDTGLFEGDAATTSNEGATALPTADSFFYTYTFDIIRKLDTLVRSDNSTLIVLSYPDDPNATSTEAWHTNPRFMYLENFAQKANIQWWDPSPYLAAARDHAPAFTNAGDNHLIEPGHAALAEYLQKQFIQELARDPRCTSL